MFIITHRRWFFVLTGLVVLASIASIAVFGLSMGSDFAGGSLVQVSYSVDRPGAQVLTQRLENAGFSGFSLREYGADGYVLRTQALTDAQRTDLAATFSTGDARAHVDQLTEVGPTIGAELRNKAWVALALVLGCILLFIAFAFRKVSQPVSSWVYGLIALIALLHDVVVPVGFYALLGHLTGVQVDTLFVTAVLTVLGFSVHDTIVVFDRTRENLAVNQERNRREPFAETAGRSLQQTFVRSINTSLTVLFTLVVLFAIGPASTKDFALTLLVGIIAGTYSSIFLATPLLVEVEQRWGRKA